MAADVPYMPSVTNVVSIFDRIRGAGTPPKFTHDFLKSVLGFGSSNDRAIVKILRALGFLTADGTPTPRYNEFKGERGGIALAAGIREGWSEFFLADQKINTKSKTEIQGVAKTVTGAGDSVAQKMASTFKTLCEQADWTVRQPSDSNFAVDHSTVDDASKGADGSRNQNDLSANGSINGNDGAGGLGLFQLHHDIHIHLPPTTEVSVYRAIFQAIKAELM